MKKNLLPNIKTIYQPNGYTCGTTSLFNLAICMNKEPPPLMELAGLMGTNPHTGTTDIEMEKGLMFFNLPIKRYAPKENGEILSNMNSQGPKEALNVLKSCIDRNEVFLWRTTMGGFHWVLVHGYDNESIMFTCSVSGKQIQDENFVYQCWEPRNFDGYRVQI